MPISMEDHAKRGTRRMLARRTGLGCEAVRVQARRISSAKAHQDIAFHLPRSESGTRCSRIARIRSNRGGGAHDHLRHEHRAP